MVICVSKSKPSLCWHINVVLAANIAIVDKRKLRYTSASTKIPKILEKIILQHVGLAFICTSFYSFYSIFVSLIQTDDFNPK